MSGLITTDHIDFRRGAAPGNPSAGVDRTYWKNDGLPYTRDSAGVERAFLLSTVPEANKVLIDNTAEAWAVVQGSDRYMVFKTTDGAEEVIVGADPASVTTAKLTMRAGLGGWAATSTGGMTLDSAAALEINSSAGPISIGNDAVNQAMNYGTLGTRTLTFGSANASFVYTGASFISNLKDNVAQAYVLQEGANKYYEVITTNGSEETKFGNLTTNPKHTFLGTGLAAFGGSLNVTGTFTPGVYSQVAGTFTYNVPAAAFNVTALSELHTISDNLASAWKVQEGANAYITVDTTNGSEKITLGSASVSVEKGLDVGGVITTKMGVTTGLAATVGGTLYINDDVSGLVQNTNVETAFDKASPSMPANTWLVGRRLRVRAAGTAVDTNGGGQQLTIRVQLLIGGVTPITIQQLQFNANDGDVWSFDIAGHILNTGNANTRVMRHLSRFGSGNGAMPVNASQGATGQFDTAQTSLVRVTAQWQNQHVDNKARLDYLEVEIG